jgi:hypothetical protein
MGDPARDVVPHFELELIADRHYLLLIVVELLDVDNDAAVLVHVLDALVILKVPHLDVAL